MAQEEGSDQFPFEIHELDERQKEILGDNNSNGDILVGEKRWFTRFTYKKFGPLFYNFQIRPDDVWLLGFLRSGTLMQTISVSIDVGLIYEIDVDFKRTDMKLEEIDTDLYLNFFLGTTVTQEIVWLICNDLDFSKAEELTVRERFPALEHILYYNAEVNPDGPIENVIIAKSWNQLFETTERRFIKTHIPFDLLPKNFVQSGCKIIYLIRDPREIIVSNYLIYQKFAKHEHLMEFSVFWKRFKNNLVMFGPYFEHIKEAWAHKNATNVLIVFYEELITNQKIAIEKIAKFFEKSLSEENIESIHQYCKNTIFTKHSKVNISETNEEARNKEKNKFVKKEQIWKKYFVNEMEDELEEWIEENLRDTDIKFCP